MSLEITRSKAFLIVLAFWGLIYLPEIGTLELDSQEGGRVLPSREMLNSGRWIVAPYGGRDYYNKPPGINWLVAASFAITGVESELTARLPTVLLVLATAAMMIWTRGPWLDVPARLMAAVVFLTANGIASAGRHAYIEGAYVCLTGMATFWWLDVWSRRGSRWLLWLVPAVLMAYGALIKGPIIGALFYCTVIAVLVYERRIREFFRLPHLVGIAIILLLCLGWVYLAFQNTARPGAMASTWASQWLVRFAPDEEHRTTWAYNVLRALAKFLPWLLFVPALWMKRFTANIAPEHRGLFRACRLSMVIDFALINAMPATLPRYSLPIFPLAAVVVGWLLSRRRPAVDADVHWKRGVLAFAAAAAAGGVVALAVVYHAPTAWAVAAAGVLLAAALFRYRKAIESASRLALATAAVTAVAVTQYVVFTTPYYLAREEYRPHARVINQAAPPGQTLYVFRPGKEKALFYVRPPLEYLMEPGEIDAKVRYLMIYDKALHSPALRQVASRRLKTLAEYTTIKHGPCYLLELSGLAATIPSPP